MLFVALVTSFGLLGSSFAERESPASLNPLIEQALTSWRAPGCVVAIVRTKQAVYLQGHGFCDPERRTAFTADTIVPYASCSKAFLTTLLARMVETEKLTWDDPVRKHLPDFRLADPIADAAVTLRDLCSHRTGLAGYDLMWDRVPWTVAESVRRLRYLPPAYLFRSGYRYQSLCFSAAGLALSARIGKPWEEQLRDELLVPLGLSSIRPRTSEHRAEVCAVGCSRRADGTWLPMPRVEFTEPNAAVSLAGSTRDLATWLRFQLGGGSLDGKRLLSQDALAETHTPMNALRLDAAARLAHPDTHQLSHGLGWVILDHRGEQLVAHSGYLDGFRLQVTMLPKRDLGLVVVVNLDGTRFANALTNTLIDHLLELPPRDWNTYYLDVERQAEKYRRDQLEKLKATRRTDTKPSLPLACYTGDYEDEAFGKATVLQEDGSLVVQWHRFRWKLEHWQEDVFLLRDERLGDFLIPFRVNRERAVAFGSTEFRFRR